MKYKVGDKVRVRKDLEVSKWYGELTALNTHMEHIGKVITITRISDGENYDVKESIMTFSEEMLEPYTFTKSDLMTGDVVENAIGIRKIVLLNTKEGDILINDRELGNLKNYKEDLTNKISGDCTIVKVRRPSNGHQMLIGNWHEMDVLWEREKPIIELTLEDIAKLKGVDVDQIRIKE